MRDRSPDLLSDVVVCAPWRTPGGRFGGALAPLSAAELGAAALTGLLAREQLTPDRIDEVVMGHCYPTSEAPNIGRVVALDAGLPVTTTGVQVDRRCGSGPQAVLHAALQVASGAQRLIVAGGVESMSNIPHHTTDMRWGARTGQMELHDPLVRGRVTPGGKNYPVEGGMLETAETPAREYDISREEQDTLALDSHQRALAAIDQGVFADEILPFEVPGRKGAVTVVGVDEHPRRGLTRDTLAARAPVRLDADPGATVTAANASGQNDGAAVCIVTDPQTAEQLGLELFARIRSWTVAGMDPRRMGIGPAPAVDAALARAGLTLKDVDLLEVNEAFAAQVLACVKTWGLGKDDLARLNVHGSGISLGHPVGATGVRILTTFLREMKRREASVGVETMCIGGGQGLAAVFELVS
ncbi:acetyl-CoA C-acetyltransferase [Rhodococcus wratislaviensis]|uniref:Probable acetyl-CoA acetyltransferase n=1 Tax=Rhodococcus wratislaviensis NBRC 100605 TaxID=1219028 RepID=X0PXI7_RHOWR|nr:acetyl-CoA C-acetyltransferase [Rhodococcus wratislaviensis]GAF43042.1 putative acetyl-CoA acetyltransferase [Rhodococcus wratislaviensis NBRC 100605]